MDALLQYGCSVQISDDYGRTPLHDACWTASPNFETVKLILGEDRHLLYITDARGATPLSYVAKENRPKWVDFIDSIKDIHWPHRRDASGFEKPPRLAQKPPNSNPAKDPPNALGISMALKVASGEIDVNDLLQCLEDDDASVSSTDSESEESNTNRTARTAPVAVGYDDDDFLTSEEIAMTLAKYDDAKYLLIGGVKGECLATAISNVKTTKACLLPSTSTRMA